jgi:nucleoside-diphosphate-sugar epimerase
MRVLIAGGSGVIGRYLVPLLVQRGHEVTALARSPKAAGIVTELGARAVTADILSAATLPAAVSGQDVVIHAASSIPRTFPGKPADFAQNDRIRREGTANLLKAMRESGNPRLVAQSIVWVHGDQRGAWIDEDGPLKPPPLARSAVELESQVRAWEKETGGVAQVLRCAALYAAEAFHTREILDRLKKRLAPIMGAGDNYQCFAHAADIASAFALAAESDRSATYLVTDDEPVQLGEYLRWVAKASGAPEPMRVPQFMARMALGQEMFDAYSASLRCRNGRIKQALGWVPKYPNFREGYEQEVLPRMKGTWPP